MKNQIIRSMNRITITVSINMTMDPEEKDVLRNEVRNAFDKISGEKDFLKAQVWVEQSNEPQYFDENGH
jgi:hypothetical protein